MRKSSRVEPKNKGSAAARRAVAGELEPGHEWLGLTPVEAAFFGSIVRSMPRDWFDPSDLPLLAAYCRAAADADAAHKRLAEELPIEINAAGTRKPNPNFRIVADSTQQMARLARKLRLCPSARYDPKSAARRLRHSAVLQPCDLDDKDPGR